LEIEAAKESTTGAIGSSWTGTSTAVNSVDSESAATASTTQSEVQVDVEPEVGGCKTVSPPEAVRDNAVLANGDAVALQPAVATTPEATGRQSLAEAPVVDLPQTSCSSSEESFPVPPSSFAIDDDSQSSGEILHQSNTGGLFDVDAVFQQLAAAAEKHQPVEAAAFAVSDSTARADVEVEAKKTEETDDVFLPAADLADWSHPVGATKASTTNAVDHNLSPESTEFSSPVVATVEHASNDAEEDGHQAAIAEDDDHFVLATAALPQSTFNVPAGSAMERPTGETTATAATSDILTTHDVTATLNDESFAASASGSAAHEGDGLKDATQDKWRHAEEEALSSAASPAAAQVHSSVASEDKVSREAVKAEEAEETAEDRHLQQHQQQQQQSAHRGKKHKDDKRKPHNGETAVC
jgi:ribosomal protein L20A (L18A)